MLDLGEGLGLNPGMTGLKSLWDAEQLAVVRGVGYPQADRSHFRSMAIWQTASPVSPATTGWLGRWLDATTHRPAGRGVAGVGAARRCWPARRSRPPRSRSAG